MGLSGLVRGPFHDYFARAVTTAVRQIRAKSKMLLMGSVDALEVVQRLSGSFRHFTRNSSVSAQRGEYLVSLIVAIASC